MSYLFVEGVEGAGAFVPAGAVEEVSDWLQPVNIAPNTKPSSTIRVYVLFIVGVTFTKTLKRTSKILNHRFGRVRPQEITGRAAPRLVAALVQLNPSQPANLQSGNSAARSVVAPATLLARATSNPLPRCGIHQSFLPIF